MVQEGGACLLDSQCLEPLQFCNRENPLNMHCQFVVRFCFVEFFGGLECVGHSCAYVAHFCIFEKCLDSNSESCGSKQVRYQLSLPFIVLKACRFFALWYQKFDKASSQIVSEWGI